MEDEYRDILSTGISAFHTQLVNDALWVVFYLLPIETDPVSVGPRAYKIWGKKSLFKIRPERGYLFKTIK